MAGPEKRETWTTLSLDRHGHIIDVKNRYGKEIQARVYGDKSPAPEEGGKCPEGETEITVVKTVELVFVTCADTSDPCWVYDSSTRRWYYTCG